ncbi:MAG: hypothetical protein ABI625_03535 [bacterium]
MKALYAVHILAGSVAVILGFVALYSAKGASLHRKSGILFVYVMLTMALLGMSLAVLRNKLPEVNIPAGLIVSYMVITALTTVRPASADSRRRWWLNAAGILVASAVGVTMLTFGVEAIANGGRRNGIPACPYLLFTTFAVLGVVGDVRVMRSGALKGGQRLARHLWRMSAALFIASLSLGQITKFIPQPYRFRAFIVLPMVAVIATMLYWLWRVQFKRSMRGIVTLMDSPASRAESAVPWATHAGPSALGRPEPLSSVSQQG